MDNKTEYFDDDKPEDFKCDCVYPCDDYPECGGVRVTFSEPIEKEGKCNCETKDIGNTRDGNGVLYCLHCGLNVDQPTFSEPPSGVEETQEDDAYSELYDLLDYEGREVDQYDYGLPWGDNKDAIINKMKSQFTITRKNK